MRRIYFLVFVVLGIVAVTEGQTTSSDSQALQALLTELHGLRKDLQVSLPRMQSAQILLSRLQLQEVAVTRASQHLDNARSRLAEIQVVLTSQGAEVKQLEDHSPNPGETAEQVEEVVNRAKADLEVSTNLEQQRQATEAEAAQQLRTEQEKLSRLETQLDELAKNVSNPAGQ